MCEYYMKKCFLCLLFIHELHFTLCARVCVRACEHCHEDMESGGIALPFLISALDGGE